MMRLLDVVRFYFITPSTTNSVEQLIDTFLADNPLHTVKEIKFIHHNPKTNQTLICITYEPRRCYKEERDK